MKSQILSSLAGIVIGTGATLGLATFTGTSDLDSIKNLFDSYNYDVEADMGEVVSHYSVTVDNANAEIGEYKEALEQANGNIDKLINAYMSLQDEYELLESDLIWTQGQLNDKKDEVSDLEDEVTALEQDLSDIKAQVETTKTQVDSDVAKLVEEANAQIEKANEEVAETNEYINGKIVESDTYNKSGNDRIAETEKVLDITEGKPEVTDITGIVE